MMMEGLQYMNNDFIYFLSVRQPFMFTEKLIFIVQYECSRFTQIKVFLLKIFIEYLNEL